jgi:hypothetical protein
MRTPGESFDVSAVEELFVFFFFFFFFFEKLLQGKPFNVFSRVFFFVYVGNRPSTRTPGAGAGRPAPLA